MRLDQRRDDVLQPVDRYHRLDPELGNVLLSSPLPDCRIGVPPAEERPGSRGVPGAALVLADPPRARLEDGLACDVERLQGNEPDQLDATARSRVQIASSSAA